MLSLFNLLASFYYSATRTTSVILSSYVLFVCVWGVGVTFLPLNFILHFMKSVYYSFLRAYSLAFYFYIRRCSFIQTINNENVGNIMHYYGYTLPSCTIYNTQALSHYIFPYFSDAFILLFLLSSLFGVCWTKVTLVLLMRCNDIIRRFEGAIYFFEVN